MIKNTFTKRDASENPVGMAMVVAAAYHKTQLDKADKPYVMHLISVAGNFNDPITQAIAILHDVVEDTDCTLETLVSIGFHKDIIDGVDAMTRRHGESYARYIKRVKQNRRARKVKIADITHNLMRSRMNGKPVDPTMEKNRGMYWKALATLDAKPLA